MGRFTQKDISLHNTLLLLNTITESGWYISGGAALYSSKNNHFHDKNFQDIDVFCESEEVANQLIDGLEKLSILEDTLSRNDDYIFEDVKSSAKKTKYATTFYFSYQQIQVITYVYGKPEEVLSDFDIDICSVWIDPKNKLHYLTEDIEKNVFFGQFYIRPEGKIGDVLSRIAKYSSRGFKLKNPKVLFELLLKYPIYHDTRTKVVIEENSEYIDVKSYEELGVEVDLNKILRSFIGWASDSTNQEIAMEVLELFNELELPRIPPTFKFSDYRLVVQNSNKLWDDRCPILKSLKPEIKIYLVEFGLMSLNHSDFIDKYPELLL